LPLGRSNVDDRRLALHFTEPVVTGQNRPPGGNGERRHRR
jgi:hypothetical protein